MRERDHASNPKDASATHARRGSSSLATELGAGFGFLTMLSMGISGFALDRTGKMDRATAEVRDNDLPGAVLVATIGATIGNLRSWQAHEVLMTSLDAATRRDAAAKLDEAIAAVTAARQACEHRSGWARNGTATGPCLAAIYRSDVQQTAAYKSGNLDKPARDSYEGKSRQDFETLIKF